MSINRKEPIFTYDPEAKADGDMVKEIITAGMTRSNGRGGAGVVEVKYLNVTRLFEEKLGISLRVQVDTERRLATIHLERLK
ncbi:hypothetical protein P4H39_06150 [Paenibacillus lautus]|uniref:hypothetical protein n=1 Tax=Paenibacillus lautus TaxID=1401 RepID=UPI002DB9CE89|nr:hypothetical protein [Paenibacillus lautus]MEC0202209.1 hypothetical protein [Paenibacillus lautus]